MPSGGRVCVCVCVAHVKPKLKLKRKCQQQQWPAALDYNSNCLLLCISDIITKRQRALYALVVVVAPLSSAHCVVAYIYE